MPSLFTRRRRPSGPEDGPEPTDAAADAEPAADTGAGPEDGDAEPDESRSRRGYTPSKKERGLATPKRPNPRVRRPGAAPATRSRKDLTKEERQQLREERRKRRREVSEGMRRGDERYLTARDRGPERRIAREVVDSRRTVGTYFFAVAIVVLLLSPQTMPPVVRLVANVMWAVLALAIIVDCTLLCRKTKRLIRDRVPDSTQRLGGTYFYVVMRSITFRKLRIPVPQKKFGDPV